MLKADTFPPPSSQPSNLFDRNSTAALTMSTTKTLRKGSKKIRTPFSKEKKTHCKGKCNEWCLSGTNSYSDLTGD